VRAVTVSVTKRVPSCGYCGADGHVEGRCPHVMYDRGSDHEDEAGSDDNDM
jgi:hypothetical protein